MINCIVAVEKNQGIGFNNQMPWPHLKDDMKWFKEKTINNIVIMGRKTWNSLGNKILPNRINLVLSKNKIEGCNYSSNDKNQLLNYCNKFYPNKEIYIIGGGTVYNLYFDLVDRFYVTEIDNDFHCDTFFDLNHVKQKFKNVVEISTFNTPLKYTIKEYNL